MLLFLDNDIILKLSAIGLLNEIEHMFSSSPAEIFILPSARLYIAKSKTVKAKYSAETMANALLEIEKYSIIPDEYLDYNKFSQLAEIEGIDSGEQILFSLNVPANNYFILTGDKRALQALSESASNISRIHSGRIICLERLFMNLLEVFPTDDLLEKIQAAGFCGDTAIRICFSQIPPEKEKIKEGLNSYFLDLKAKTGILLLEI